MAEEARDDMIEDSVDIEALERLARWIEVTDRAPNIVPDACPVGSIPQAPRGLITKGDLRVLIRRVREAEEQVRKCEDKDQPISAGAIHAIRHMLNEANVPQAAFIDDHVGNAIVQRNVAEQRIAELEGLLREAREHVEAASAIQRTPIVTDVDRLLDAIDTALGGDNGT